MAHRFMRVKQAVELQKMASIMQQNSPFWVKKSTAP